LNIIDGELLNLFMTPWAILDLVTIFELYQLKHCHFL